MPASKKSFINFIAAIATLTPMDIIMCIGQ